MRIWLLVAVFFFASVQTHAKKVEGGFVSGGKETEVTFEVRVPLFANEPNFERTQFKIRYYDKNGKLQVLKPVDAEEIWFNYEGRDVRMISVENTLGAGSFFIKPKRIFLKLEIDGPLRLYRYYYKVSSPGMYSPGGGYSAGVQSTVDNFIFQKRNGPLKQPRTMGWKKDMLAYFSDCPGLGSLIESKTLRRDEMEAITRLYNRTCATK